MFLTRGDPSIFPAEANGFVWFVRNRFDLRAALVRDAQTESARARLERRFHRGLREAKQLLALRLIVTVLLTLGVLATTASGVFALLSWAEFQAADRALRSVAATAASASIFLLGVRLLIERMLARYDVATQFLASRLAERPQESGAT